MQFPEPDCWLSPLARVAQSAIEGEGLFATAPITRGTVISHFGGRLVTDAELRQLLTDASAAGVYVDTLSIGQDHNLVLPPGVPNHAGNHSCNPNMWWADPYTVVTRQEVDSGEELTLDYATITDDSSFEMRCSCRSAFCRGQVTGLDWQLRQLQAEYGQHWVPVLRERIDNS